MVEKSIALLGVTLTPKFMFGCNGHLRNNLYVTDEGKKLLYSAGNNVIVYNPEDGEAGSQTILAGSDNNERINFITVSPSDKYVAMCERGERALVTIYNITSRDKRNRVKQIPDGHNVDRDFPELHGVQEFLAAAFSPKDEHRLFTLVGDPAWSVLLWHWTEGQASKILSRVDLTNRELLKSAFDGSTSLSSSFMMSLY